MSLCGSWLTGQKKTHYKKVYMLVEEVTCGDVACLKDYQ